MRKKAFYILILTLIPSLSKAQYLRLSNATAGSALYLNTGRIFSYNRYDGGHVEGSFYYAIPNQYDASASPTAPQWQFTGYAGYGGKSHYTSFGGSVAMQDRKTTHRWKPTVSFCHELEQAGRIALQDYNLLNPSQNTVYMTDRFSAIDRLSLGLSGRFGRNNSFSINLRQSIERQLFAQDGTLLYDNAELNQQYKYTEAQLRLTHNSKLTLDIVAGMTDFDQETAYLRGIVQYSRTCALGSRIAARLFSQGGYATSHTPYSRIFDISGTYGSYFFFTNTMLTVNPNEFHAHLYARGTVALQTQKPLWQCRFSAPTPFVQAGLLYGWLTHEGKLTAHATVNGMALNAPTQGVLEPSIGINSLLRWSRLDIGIAAAVRLTPNNAYYHQADSSRDFALMFTAQII